MNIKQILFLSVCVSIPVTAMAHDILGFPRHKGVEPLKNSTYQQNCAECHFAYQPGLLPARSWAKLMQRSELANHFGENAEVPEADRLTIEAFLTQNGADTTWHYKRSIKINQSIPDDVTPMRITQVPYFKKKHGEIPRKMIEENARVRSLSYCNKCHTEAHEGVFDNGTVDIPNFRNWDDLID
ncbi:MAG: diheme cytochrome c [Zetaproteobacteria bacterium]|nr:diheme cytochrome c [Zetaproteobacteria bacterium]